MELIEPAPQPVQAVECPLDDHHGQAHGRDGLNQKDADLAATVEVLLSGCEVAGYVRRESVTGDGWSSLPSADMALRVSSKTSSQSGGAPRS
jgi:hypothetical protein